MGNNLILLANSTKKFPAPEGQRNLAGAEARAQAPGQLIEYCSRPCRDAWRCYEVSGGYASLHHRLMPLAPPALNEQSKRGWPHPETYVIDGAGVVRWKFVEVNYKARPSNEDVLVQVKKADTNIK